MKKLNLFASSDSKYFIGTAFKLTLIPLVSFMFTAYSLWIFLEMTYGFFVANGFVEGVEYKDAFMDHVMMNVNHFALYIGAYFCGVFFLGLGLSYLTLRPFNSIKKFAEKFLQDPFQEFKMNGMDQSRVMSKAAYYLFYFLKEKQKKDKADLSPIEAALEEIKKPTMDKVFYLQYGIFAFALFATNAFALYAFSTELHSEIVTASFKLLKSAPASTGYFLREQDALLRSILVISVVMTASFYISLASSMIQEVEGASYALFRDIRNIIKGDYKKRLRPRNADPGLDAANAMNDCIDFFLQAAQAEKSFDKKPENVIPMTAPKDSNPPPFVQEVKVSGGSSFYNLITPKGYKLDSLSYDELIKILKDMERI